MSIDYSRFDRLRVELDAGVLRLTLNRPDKRNILDDPINEQISDVIQAATLDEAVRVIVLAGEG